jgi:tetratricopeptide (TPR) repeat protein
VLPTLLGSLLLFGAAPSGPDQQVVALFRQSTTEYELGDFDAALADIAKAYRLDPRPGLLFNLGQCHRALHHWERAAFFYGEYLHKTPAAPNRAVVAKLIVEMNEKLAAEAAAPEPGLVEAPATNASPPRPVEPAPVAAPAAASAVPAEAPAAAVEASPAPAHSHALGIGLLTTGLAFGVLAGISALEIVHYNGAYAGPANQNLGTVSYSPSFSQAQSQVGVWQVVEITSAILAVAGVGAAAFTW